MLPRLRSEHGWALAARRLYNGESDAYHHNCLRAVAAEVGGADPTRPVMERCTIEGCPGHYEARFVTHTVRQNDQLVVIDHVPADVCSACGDVLLSPATLRAIEQILCGPSQPSGAAPIYEFRKAS